MGGNGKGRKKGKGREKGKGGDGKGRGRGRDPTPSRPLIHISGYAPAVKSSTHILRLFFTVG